jgi:hypothetical protein
MDLSHVPDGGTDPLATGLLRVLGLLEAAAVAAGIEYSSAPEGFAVDHALLAALTAAGTRLSVQERAVLAQSLGAIARALALWPLGPDTGEPAPDDSRQARPGRPRAPTGAELLPDQATHERAGRRAPRGALLESTSRAGGGDDHDAARRP